MDIKKKEEPEWSKYKKIVAQIHKTLSPNANITHNDKILGFESKILRQIDVSIRQKIGPYEILIIVQCKDYTNKVDINDVGEFITVIKDIRANKGVVVSNSGFTEGAINLAKENNVSLCSVFDAQNKDWSTIVKIPFAFDLRVPMVRFGVNFITDRSIEYD